MSKEENTRQLKTAVINHKSLKIFLEGEYYDTFEHKGEMYQGEFGRLDIVDVLKAIDGLIPHIRLEVAE